MQINELIKTTIRKRDYYITDKEDLINFIKENKLSKDCIRRCNAEIVKADKNIDYYSSLLEILEGENNE